MSLDQLPADYTGPLALVVSTDGIARAVRMPDDSPAAPVKWLQDLIGGHFEGIGGTSGGEPWIAYLAEDGEHLALNVRATALARHLGWLGHPADYLLGTVVFLGRRGTEETDVPERVLALAGTAGVQ